MSEWTQETHDYWKAHCVDNGWKHVELAVSQDDMKALLTEIEECHTKLENITQIFINLMYYRRRNTVNFQLEKMDDYLRQLKEAIEEEK